MPHYDFAHIDEATGEPIDVVERFYSMSEVPDTIEIDGRTYTRQISGGVISNDVANKTHGYPYVSIQYPLGTPGAGAYTKDGRPIITSRRNEREFCARNNLVRI